MKLNITRFTKAVLDIMFVLGILITATLPFLLKTYGKYVEPGIEKYIWQNSVVLGLCGIFSLMIVWELRKMFKTVIADDCFVRNNVTSLKKMSIYSVEIVFFMAVKCLFNITLATMAIMMVFIIAGLFSRVLAQVFDKAVTYKLENDLTI
ncbi:DUF2975 domain-containing protein [Eubacterium sp. CAG:161]|uniref:DUF2975 domain-containing protein n=1 Tax=Eubacterium sp. CAG:161 TaxID=1262881 RepID=UPI00033DB58C|nr:DUF2975 domain-containing protein [Eubacterium sp. CAG:161]CCY68808.1 putative uncharacterized protein [Eubacterium sp. CAG:161]